MAFAVRGRDVVAWAPNTHSTHAEVALVQKAERMGVRPGFDVVVVRFMRNCPGSVGESRPCERCREFLGSRAGIVKNVWWSTSSGEFAKDRPRRLVEKLDIRDVAGRPDIV